MKKILIFIIILLPLISFSQDDLGTAKELAEKEEWLAAKTSIDKVFGNASMQNNPEAWYYKGTIYEGILNEIIIEKIKDVKALDMLDASAAAYKESVKKGGKTGTYTVKAIEQLDQLYSNYIVEGNQFLKEHDPQVAYDNYSKALDINRFTLKYGTDFVLDTELIYLLAANAEATKRYVEAAKAYHELIDLEFENTNIYIKLSHIYQEQNQKEKAIQIIDLGLSRYPKDENLIMAKAAIFIRQEKTKKAIQFLEEVIKENPYKPSLYLALGRIHRNLMKEEGSKEETAKNFKRAEFSFERAMNLSDNNFEAVSSLGILYFNKALEISRGMNKNNPELSDLSKRRVMLNKAEKALVKAYNLNPRNDQVKSALRYVYLNTNQPEKARELQRFRR